MKLDKKNITSTLLLLLLLEGRTPSVNCFVNYSSSSSPSTTSFVSSSNRITGYKVGQSIWQPQDSRKRRSHRSGSSTGMSMMFDQLSTAITQVAETIGGRPRMTEKSIQKALKDVRRALLDADVNLNVADTLIEGVKKRSVGQVVTKGVTADQQFIKVMYDELLNVMGGDPEASSTTTTTDVPVATLARGTKEQPAVVLLAGLQGAGKTTAAGKLALYLKEREVDYEAVAAMPKEESEKLLPVRMPKTKRKVLLAAADVYRPAAIEQLKILGESVGVDVFTLGQDADPVDIAKQAVDKAIAEGYDTVLVDTAGRQVIDTDLMDELKRIKETVNPDETLLVVDAMTGQEAASLTLSFDTAVGITGAVLSKLDGDSRGGAAVSVRGVSGKPIKFVGTGEKPADLEPFYPDRMAQRILGMGDVVSLVEKAAAEVSDAEALRMQEKMLDATFDFDDFLKQSELVGKMGSIGGVAKMLPGMGNMVSDKQLKDVEARLKRSKAMIQSMTKQERRSPELLITDKTARSRIIRITKGAGQSYDDGILFMSEFQKMKTMMSRMQKQMAGSGGGDANNMEEAMAGGQLPPIGNRASRRASKKKKKGGRGGGMGFGA